MGFAKRVKRDTKAIWADRLNVAHLDFVMKSSIKHFNMAQDPLPNPMLDYLPQHRVVRCVACQYAVPPSALPRHMKDLHHIHRGRRRSLLEYAATLDLADPADVVLPKPYEPPVPSLPIEDGVACCSDGCGYLSMTKKRMKRHWVTYHDAHGTEGTDWRSVKLQTFFRGNNLRYFIVTPEQNETSVVLKVRTSTECG